MPACAPCNTELNRRFEEPAKPVVRRLKKLNWAGGATSEEWRALGLWLAKNLLMLGNPRARWEHPRIDQGAVRFYDEPPGLTWLTNGAPVPEGLSLWVFNSSLDPGDVMHRVPIPRVVRYSAAGNAHFHLLMQAEEGICVTLVSHPGWRILHPLVEAGVAWELLRDTPPDADLSALPRLGYKAVRWASFDSTLREGVAMGDNLPPLRSTNEIIAPEIADVLDSFGI